MEVRKPLAFFVQCDAAIQPAGVRVRADEQEEVTQGTGVGSPTLPAQGRALAERACFARTCHLDRLRWGASGRHDGLERCARLRIRRLRDRAN